MDRPDPNDSKNPAGTRQEPGRSVVHVHVLSLLSLYSFYPVSISPGIGLRAGVGELLEQG